MSGDEALLEHHTLVVRDGRILDVLPHAAAAERYVARVLVERPMHLLMPGLVNAHTRIGAIPHAAAGLHAAAGPHAATGPHASPGPGFQAETALAGIANMLKAGITCFCDIGYFPRDTAQMAAAQGMRAHIGLPVAEQPSPWARTAAEYLSLALRVRDEYKGHPSISTGFAPLRPGLIGDATFARLGTLANELDAGILVSLHESESEVEDSLQRHGVRPIARLDRLGLLTPALTAVQMACLAPADIDLAQRAGIGITLCLASNLKRGNGWPPLARLAAAQSRETPTRVEGIRISLGSDGEFCGATQDLWTEIKLLALAAPAAQTGLTACLPPWRVLAAATRGGAAVLGLEAEIGTLEAGKWADLCCIDLGGPATQPLHDPIEQLAFAGGRDMVSDVWVAGRQLLCDGQFTRLDWSNLAARLGSHRPAAQLEVDS